MPAGRSNAIRAAKNRLALGAVAAILVAAGLVVAGRAPGSHPAAPAAALPRTPLAVASTSPALYGFAGPPPRLSTTVRGAPVARGREQRFYQPLGLVRLLPSPSAPWR